MPIRVRYVHKITPRDADAETYEGTPADVADLEAARRFCRRHDLSLGNRRHDRMEDGKAILFPTNGSWHSMILSWEPEK